MHFTFALVVCFFLWPFLVQAQACADFPDCTTSGYPDTSLLCGGECFIGTSETFQSLTSVTFNIEGNITLTNVNILDTAEIRIEVSQDSDGEILITNCTFEATEIIITGKNSNNDEIPIEIRETTFLDYSSIVIQGTSKNSKAVFMVDTVFEPLDSNSEIEISGTQTGVAQDASVVINYVNQILNEIPYCTITAQTQNSTGIRVINTQFTGFTNLQSDAPDCRCSIGVQLERVSFINSDSVTINGENDIGISIEESFKLQHVEEFSINGKGDSIGIRANIRNPVITIERSIGTFSSQQSGGMGFVLDGSINIIDTSTVLIDYSSASGGEFKGNIVLSSSSILEIFGETSDTNINQACFLKVSADVAEDSSMLVHGTTIADNSVGVFISNSNLQSVTVEGHTNCDECKAIKIINSVIDMNSSISGFCTGFPSTGIEIHEDCILENSNFYGQSININGIGIKFEQNSNPVITNSIFTGSCDEAIILSHFLPSGDVQFIAELEESQITFPIPAEDSELNMNGSYTTIKGSLKITGTLTTTSVIESTLHLMTVNTADNLYFNHMGSTIIEENITGTFCKFNNLVLGGSCNPNIEYVISCPTEIQVNTITGNSSVANCNSLHFESSLIGISGNVSYFLKVI